MGAQTNEQITLLTDYDPNSNYSVAYQTLYTNIRLSWQNTMQGQIQTVLLTTPAPFSGSAIAVANVAIAAAQNGIATILIDADLHTPHLHRLLTPNEQTGLSDILAASTSQSQQIISHLHKTTIPDLRFLGSGSIIQQYTESSRLLSIHIKIFLHKLQQELQEQEQRQHIIIINSSPVLSGVDTSLISANVDQTFLLIAKDHTTGIQAKKAQEQLERAHTQLTGLVMLDI
ncbi:MAG TPA: hypothetical protein VL461_06530 [Dictyobacter sp.]|nr:hypothetical protein [Dictyobacter sp.]